MSVLRYKYRPAAIQPELLNGKENTSLSIAKKVKEVEVDPYTLLDKLTNEDPIFVVSHTQNQRIEVYIASNEEAFRRKHYPTIEERIEQQKEWTKIQLREAKLASQREAQKLSLERDLLITRKKQEAVDAAKVGDHETAQQILEEVKQLEESNDNLDQIPPDPNAPGGLPLTDDVIDTEVEVDTNMADFAEELLKIREKKLLTSRKTLEFHREWTKYERRKFAWRVKLNWIGKQDKDITQVLPWLLVGRKEVSNNLQTLLKLEITHVLNMTNDLPNCFPSHFIYKRIPIKDNTDAKIAMYFADIINFIKRVQKCKGRILVHCSVGSSRAPTAVLSYLVVERGIPLCDAYNYLLVLRPLIAPNLHFLFELAMLECSLGEGCSVYYSREWRFYEFNTFRAQQVAERKSMGLMKAVMHLLDKYIDPSDLLS